MRALMGWVVRCGAVRKDRRGRTTSNQEHGGEQHICGCAAAGLVAFEGRRGVGSGTGTGTGTGAWVPARGRYAADDRLEQVDLPGPLEA